MILGFEVVYRKCKKKIKPPDQAETLDPDEAISNLQNINVDLEFIKKKYSIVQYYIDRTSEQQVTNEILESMIFVQRLQEFVKYQEENGPLELENEIEGHKSETDLSEIEEIVIDEMMNVEDVGDSFET